MARVLAQHALPISLPTSPQHLHPSRKHKSCWRNRPALCPIVSRGLRKSASQLANQTCRKAKPWSRHRFSSDRLRVHASALDEGSPPAGCVEHVIIVGGGMAGLALGLALHRRGISFDVYERREGPGLGPGTLQTLFPNGLRALDAIQPGLAKQMIEAGQEVKVTKNLTFEGVQLSSFDFTPWKEKYGYPALFMHWPQVLQVLEQALPYERVHYGCTFSSYTEAKDGVTAIFASDGSLDGSSEAVAKGSLLVAADGIFSAVRAAAFGGSLMLAGDGITSTNRAFAFGGGEAIRDNGSTTWRGLATKVPSGQLVAPGENKTIIDRGRIRMLTGMREGTFWFLNVEDKATGNKYRMRSKTKMEVYSRIMGEFGEWPGVAEAVGATDIDSIAEARVLDREVSVDWFESRVVCIGDSVHPLKPAAGQGSNQAFEDAFVLGRELARPGASLQSALTDYEKDRRERIRKVFEFNELCASRNPEERRKVLASGLDWLHAHQLEDLPVLV